MRTLISFILAVSFFCLAPVAASADDASPPKATATRPADHPQETSLPHDKAPDANGTQITGSTGQSATVKEMNDEGKRKLEVEGK